MGESPEGWLTPQQRDQFDATRDKQLQAEARARRAGEALEEANREIARLRDELDKQQRAEMETNFSMTGEINRLTTERNNSELMAAQWGKHAANLERCIVSCLPKLTHGEYLVVRDRLREVVARLREDEPCLWSVEGDTGVIPVAGRGLREGTVSLNPTSRGLVIRVDDARNPEFWLEIVLSQTRLLRMLARMHQARREDDLGASSGHVQQQINHNENP